ncbi:MAG: leucine-rich repeat domain-containing protein [Clostridia bacterium]|nr:leucine-rich repeat domain-containing protein [Clostridia bacterium]
MTAYNGNQTEVQMPWNVDGYVVTEVGPGAFAGNQTVRSVKLPVGVRVIRAGAFRDCVALAEVTLPSRLETIEDEAFAGCQALTTVFLPDSVTELGENCFPAATVITGHAGSIAEAYAGAVGAAYHQAAVATPTPRPVSADYQYELRNGGIYITSYIGTDYEVRVPAEIDGYPVRTIGLNAFSSRYEVETVILPEGLTALDKNAFRYCPGLTRVELPSTLQTIGDHAFYLCEGLTEIVIPEGVTEIGLRAFQGCKQLRKVTLPKSLKTISNYTFFECHKSLTIYAPKGSAAQKFAGMKGYGFVATE